MKLIVLKMENHPSVVNEETNRLIDLRDIASGIYTCTIRCNDCQVTNKLVIAQ